MTTTSPLLLRLANPTATTGIAQAALPNLLPSLLLLPPLLGLTVLLPRVLLRPRRSPLARLVKLDLERRSLLLEQLVHGSCKRWVRNMKM
jgi:hypothetical protein